MKKFYLFLAMLLGLLGSTSMMAQDEPKIDKLATIQIGAAVGSFETETWYFMYQGRYGDKGAGAYPFLYAGDIPGQVVSAEFPDIDGSNGGVMADVGLGQSLIKKPVADVLNSNPAASSLTYAGYLVRFHAVSGKEGAYTVEFGTGNYMSDPGASDGNPFKSVDNIYDAGLFNIYTIDPEKPGAFGFNVYDMQKKVDNNGVGGTVVIWGSGKHTAIAGSNSIWSIHEVIWGTADELEALVTELESLWTAHETDAEYFNNHIGTLPGQYPEGVVNAFINAMQFGYEVLDEKVELTVENLEKAIADIKTTYAAVVAAEIPFIPVDGYYRLRSGMTFTQGEENPLKYMYTVVNGTTVNARWQTPADLSSDATALWQLTKKEGGYDFVNVATEARFNNVATSTAATLSTSSTNLMEFDVAGIVGEITYVNVRVATQAANNYFYLHAGGHNSGAGVSGNIVGWNRTLDGETPKASEWVLEPVSETEVTTILAAFEEIKKREQFVADYKAMKAEAAAAIEAAKDMQSVELIKKNGNQLSSPYSQNDLGGDKDGGNLSDDVLLDGDASTYWHSYWQGGNVAQHLHYLQVALPEPVHNLISYSFSRRNNADSDHTTKWSIYGSSSPDASDDEWEELMTWDTPFGSKNESFKSAPFDTKGYQYFRIFSDATTNNRGYWHVGEVQFSYDVENPNSQYSYMGDVAVNLDKVLAEQENIEDAAITQQIFDALKKAYDDFKAEFVDPAELRALIAELQDKPAIVVVGSAPGFWLNNSTATALQQTLNDAKDYDEAGVYAATKSNQFIETLRQQSQAIDDAAISVETGKWYRIRFATEEDFENHEWDKVAGEGGTKTTYKDIQYETSEPLWGKYVVVADEQDEVLFSDDEGKVVAYHVVPADAEKVSIGHGIRLDDSGDVQDDALSYFRFVPVGDAYALQNKATGLFVKAAGTSGATTLDIIPSLFTVSALGYGLNVFTAKNLLTGEDQKWLHAQVAHNQLVTWGPGFEPYPGSRSGFYIEEIENVDAAYEGADFKLEQVPGAISARCYPVNISAEEGLYGVSKAEADGENRVKISLFPLTEVEAGRPFILISGNPEDYDAEAEAAPVALKHGYDFVTEPQEGPVLKGTFTKQTVGYGVAVPEANGFVIAKKSEFAVEAFQAWIANEEKFDREATATFEITGDSDGIAATLQKVAKSGAIYTLDGRLVTKSGNLNSLRGLAPGIYIVNGVKVTVK